jgi:hypothetical protein
MDVTALFLGIYSEFGDMEMHACDTYWQFRRKICGRLSVERRKCENKYLFLKPNWTHEALIDYFQHEILPVECSGQCHFLTEMNSSLKCWIIAWLRLYPKFSTCNILFRLHAAQCCRRCCRNTTAFISTNQILCFGTVIKQSDDV